MAAILSSCPSRRRRAILCLAASAGIAAILRPRLAEAARKHRHPRHETINTVEHHPSPVAPVLPPAPPPPTIIVQPQIAPPAITVQPAISPTEPWWRIFAAPAVALLSALVTAGSVFYARQTFRLSLARDLSTLLGQRAETERALALQAFAHRVARPIGATLDTLESLLKDVRALAATVTPTDAASALLAFSARAQLDLVTCQHRCGDADGTISGAGGTEPGMEAGGNAGRQAVFANALAANYPLEALIEAARAALATADAPGGGQAAVLNAYDRLVAICTTLQSTLRRLLETERQAEAQRRTLRLQALPIYRELHRDLPDIATGD